MGEVLFRPTEELINVSNLCAFQHWLKENKGVDCSNYQELWQWSVKDVAVFWETLLEYFDIQYDGSYHQVMNQKEMPGVQWFEGISVNYAEHLLEGKSDDQIAIYFKNEWNEIEAITYQELKAQVVAFQQFLKAQGVAAGDRVVAFLPTIPQATIAFLAANSLGAVWSSCSPDFGAESVIERFQQIKPKVLIIADGYQYNGRKYSKLEDNKAIISQLKELKAVVGVSYIQDELPEQCVPWETIIKEANPDAPTYTRVGFNEPIWVLYSSGTTGQPKAITHSVGGCLLEHYKYLTFHNEVKKGENFFWFTTTGWMMWNYLHGAMLCGASIVLYDGSPGYPDIQTLWEITEKLPIHHFGTSAPFLMACRKKLGTLKNFNFKDLKSISSTGAPLPPDVFKWVYTDIKEDLYLWSMSGGTDVCTAFVGGQAESEIVEGEIACSALGVDLDCWDVSGESLIEETGEMVIKQAMPSMPIYFWGDTEMTRYRSAYFEDYPGVWRHGDWIKRTKKGSLIIYGRSDATLNRNGIRMGTAEIYRVLDRMEEIEDSLVINIEKEDGTHYMPLFIKTNILNDNLKDKINSSLKEECSPRHVPDEIIAIPDIPYTISGKKMEAPVKKLLMGISPEKAYNKDAMRNPESMEFFITKKRSI